jgi:NFU1 iron-sulfur cluster scaffold homolog, mitochondrial
MKDQITIEAKPSHNNSVCFFTLSVPLLKDSKAEFRSAEDAMNSPLVTALFNFPWVLEVAADDLTLIIRKNNTDSWRENAKDVAALIRGLDIEGTPFFHDDYLASLKRTKEHHPAEADQPFKVNENNINNPLGKRIQKILLDVVGPSLAAHG